MFRQERKRVVYNVISAASPVWSRLRGSRPTCVLWSVLSAFRRAGARRCRHDFLADPCATACWAADTPPPAAPGLADLTVRWQVQCARGLLPWTTTAPPYSCAAGRVDRPAAAARGRRATAAPLTAPCRAADVSAEELQGQLLAQRPEVESGALGRAHADAVDGGQPGRE